MPSREEMRHGGGAEASDPGEDFELAPEDNEEAEAEPEPPPKPALEPDEVSEDGTWVYKIRKPFDPKIKRVAVQSPSVVKIPPRMYARDLRRMSAGGTAADQTFYLVASVTGIPTDVLDAMDGDDYQNVVDLCTRRYLGNGSGP